MISFNGFLREPAELRKAELDACKSVLDSGWYILGEEGDSFEREWAQYCGTTHAVGVANGMDAEEIALRALGIGPGDEVITTPMTAFATVLAIMRSGATPVLAVIDPSTGLMDLESARRCRTNRTKAIVLVHLYGHVRDMDAWLGFCETAGLYLIEDCAQSHGARIGDKVAGSFGIAAAFSFYPTKNLGAIGDAGAITTSDAHVALLAQQLRNYGQSERYHHPHVGLNSRLDEIQAAALRVRLRWMPKFTDRRRAIADRYRMGIDNSRVRILSAPDDPASHVYHQFVVLTDERDSFMAFLADWGIQTLIHYAVPVHHQASVEGIAHDPKGLASAETFARTCVSIPCHPQLTDNEVDQVIVAINAWQGP